MTILIISFTSSLELVHGVIRKAKSKGRPNPNISLWRAASVADAAAVSSNGIKTLLVGGLSIFLIKGNPVFSNGHESLPKNLPDFTILCNCVFDNFILLDDEPFAKALRDLKTCV